MTLGLSVLQAGLDQCLRTHPLCGGLQPRLLPTRLVEINVRDEVIIARLVPGAECRAPYLALSYCWGSSLRPEALRTTTVTLVDHQRLIDVTQLPSTIQDALTLTCELGYEYLWVDSLCIVQDSPEDWKQESGRRGEVFANALCTIVAPTADAQESFLSACVNRHTDGYASPPESSKCLPALFSEQLGPHQPTSSRAWCLQETEQSLRLLFFKKSDDGTLTPSFMCRTSFLQTSNPAQLQSTASSIPHEVNELIMLDSFCYWYAIVQEYSRRNLTRESDKLLALATLAARMQNRLGDSYAAGLWRGDFVHGLLWKSASGCDRPLNYVAPSWSWASVKGVVCYPHLGKTLSQNLIPTPAIMRLDLDLRENLVLSGKVTLRGRIKQVTCIARSIGSEQRVWQLTEMQDKVVGRLFVDSQNEVSEQASLLCLCIAESAHASEGEDHIVAIALQRVNGIAGSARFKRVGYAELRIRPLVDDSDLVLEII